MAEGPGGFTKIRIVGQGKNSFHGENTFGCDLTIILDGDDCKVEGKFSCNFAEEGEVTEDNQAKVTANQFQEMCNLAEQCKDTKFEI